MATAISPDTSADALAERLFGDALRALDLFCVYMGDQLALYRVLADAGPSTAQELADAAGVNGRYAREWLEQQAMGGVLEVMEVSAMDAERRYALPPGHEEVPLDQDSPFYMAPMAQLMVGGVQPIHAVLAAFRTGQGVPYPTTARTCGRVRNGSPARCSTTCCPRTGSRPCPPSTIDSSPILPPVSRTWPAAWGRSSLAIARAYPKVKVDGIDLDPASVQQAQKLLTGSDVEDRVEFSCRDAADSRLSGRYDLVTMFEALHDMAHPVDVLTSARMLLSPGGSMLVADERTAEHFAVDAGDVERLNYGMSVLHCLPVEWSATTRPARGR